MFENQVTIKLKDEFDVTNKKLIRKMILKIVKEVDLNKL